MSAPAPGFRDYGEGARASVHELYRLNHRHQTLDFVRAKKHEYLSLGRRRMSVWDALELVETPKSPQRPDRQALEPYYRELVAEFFPEPLRF